MAKRKNLLLTESTTMRMMGLAGIGSLANPFLKESNYEEVDEILDPVFNAGEKEMDEDLELEEGEELDEMYDTSEDPMMEESYDEEMEENLYEGEDNEEDNEEEGEECPSCGKVHEGMCKENVNENVLKSMRRLKKLLEQAETPPPPADEPAPAEPPPAMEGGDEMETKIKDFVKKLGELVQETLGVEVKVEEEGEEGLEPAEGGEGEAPAGAGAPPPPPAPLAEAIDRLVNKVAARVKARLIEAKKDPKVAAAKAKKLKMMKEKQMAAKKKEKEEAAKKKQMEMKNKKAAMAKKK